MMAGELKGSAVLIQREMRGYGRRTKEGTVLSLVEATYLLSVGKMKVVENGRELTFEELFKKGTRRTERFELIYTVYTDLRNRGYHPSLHAIDLKLYKRGKCAGEEPSWAIVHVLSERERITFSRLWNMTHSIEGLRRRLVIAVVDEEGDITYYLVRTVEPAGEFTLKIEETIPQPSATLLSERAIVWKGESSKALHEKFFGTMLDENRLHLSMIEVAYLLDENALTLTDVDGNKVENIIELGRSIDPDFDKKLTVYGDMRRKGLIPKTGYKFGSHFRVYKRPNKHSDYLLHIVDTLSLPEMSKSVRLAHSVRKKMLFANLIMNEVKYIEVEWFRP
ncbi:tRNA-intron lyase [Methanosarcinales archaeon]|nr:MAG: tRNA-intron lyase [Methanosarcinales archaeon]